MARALPEVPVRGAPLHQRLAEVNGLIDVVADGYGVCVYLTVAPDQLPTAADLLQTAMAGPMAAEVMQSAADGVAFEWRRVQDDSQALADWISDLALHTAPSRWPLLYEELDTAMSSSFVLDGISAFSVAGRSGVMVGPQDESATLRPLLDAPVSNLGAARTTSEPAAGVRRTRLHLNVVSDSSALIRMGWRTPPRGHPEFAPLAVAARIVGGHYGSRLMRAFRQERGWSYSPWALLRSGMSHGLWQVSVRVPAQHVSSAVAQVQEIMNDCSPDAAEHASAVAHTVAELRALWSAGDSVLSLLGYWHDLGLQPSTERNRWLERLAETSLQDVVDVVRTRLLGEPDLVLLLS